jgi:alpha-galactosidase
MFTKLPFTESGATMQSIGFFLLSAFPLGGALVSPMGVGRLPAMGWNSWNEYACDINEDVFINVADLMISLGLKDAGYNYVNIDDCWSDKKSGRDNVTQKLVADVAKFPRGIKPLAEEIHARGLKLGIYGDAGELHHSGVANS